MGELELKGLALAAQDACQCSQGIQVIQLQVLILHEQICSETSKVGMMLGQGYTSYTKSGG